MITTGQVLTQGTQTFTPIINRLIQIGEEFVPYLLYIGIGLASINLIRASVKFILRYLEKKNKMAFYTYEGTSEPAGGNSVYIYKKWKKRKHIKWKYLRRFR